MIWFTFTLISMLKHRIQNYFQHLLLNKLLRTDNIYLRSAQYCAHVSQKNGLKTKWLLLHLFLLWPNPLNSMNIKPGTTKWSWVVWVCLPLEVPLFEAVKGRPCPLVMGCQVCWWVASFRATCCWSCVVFGSVNKGHLWPLVTLCLCPAVRAPRSGRTLGPSALQLSTKWTRIGPALQGCCR